MTAISYITMNQNIMITISCENASQNGTEIRGTLLPILYVECSKKLKYFSGRYWGRYLSDFNDFCVIRMRCSSTFQWCKNHWNLISADLNNVPKSILVCSCIRHTILAGGYFEFLFIGVNALIYWCISGRFELLVHNVEDASRLPLNELVLDHIPSARCTPSQIQSIVTFIVQLLQS